MKHLATLAFFFCALGALSAQRVVTAAGFYSDAVYVPSRDALFAVRPASDVNGNQLCRIDPVTAEAVACWPVANDPHLVVATTSGNYLYLGFRGESRIQRFNLTTQSIDLDFSPGGQEDQLGPFYAEDILPLDGSDGVIAVARQNNCCYPRHEGVVLFDEGRPLPTTTPDELGSNELAYTPDPERIIGFNTEGDYLFRTMSAGANGVAIDNTYTGFTGGQLSMEYADGRVYSNAGEIAAFIGGEPNVVASVSLQGLDYYGGVAVEAVPDQNRIYYLGTGETGRMALLEVDATSYERLGVYVLDPFSQPYTGEAGRVLEQLGTPGTFAYVSNAQTLGLITLCSSEITQAPPPYTGPIFICSGQPLELVVPAGARGAGQEIIWSTGEVGDTIYVTTEGEYSYRVADTNACPGPASPAFYVAISYSSEQPAYIQPPLAREICIDGSLTLQADYYYGQTVFWNTGDTVNPLVVTEAGTYIAYGIDEYTGCPSRPSDPLVITALNAVAPPAPTVLPGTQIDTCTSQPIELSVSEPAQDYYWTVYGGSSQNPGRPSRITVYPDYSPSEFSVILRDFNGCLSPATTGFVNFLPTPQAPFVQYNSSSMTLAASEAGPLLWYRNDEFEAETTGRFYRPERNGFYSARVKGSECPSEPSNTVSVDGITTSVHDDVVSALVSVYPVPARGVVYVSVDRKLATVRAGETVRYRLFNSSGSLVSEGRMDPRASNSPISIDGLAAGVYVLNVDSLERGIVRKRITVF